MTDEPSHVEKWNAKAEFKDTTDGRIKPVDKKGLEELFEKHRPKCIEKRMENGHIVRVFEAAHADGSVVPQRVR